MKNKKLFFAIFIALSIAASFINFTPFIVGKLKFTLFDLYAPIAGGFFGPLPGTAAVFVVELANLLIKQTFTTAGILHLFPVIFGALYFGTNKKLINLVPVIAMIGFIAHPVGREVWYYAMFWLIPLLASVFKKHLVANALGATFTTHAVGGLLWIYFFSPPAAVWQGLIPIVITERLIFTLTSVIVYVLVRKVIHAVYQSKNAAIPAA